jgi:hypothetical protein
MTVWPLYDTEGKCARNSSVSTVIVFELDDGSLIPGRNFGGISDQVNYIFSVVIRIKR